MNSSKFFYFFFKVFYLHIKINNKIYQYLSIYIFIYRLIFFSFIKSNFVLQSLSEELNVFKIFSSPYYSSGPIITLFEFSTTLIFG